MFSQYHYYFEILGAITVLAPEMSTSNLHPWLENVAACFQLSYDRTRGLAGFYVCLLSVEHFFLLSEWD